MAEMSVPAWPIPICRSHDALCGGLRGHFPADSHRAPVDGLLYVPLSQHHGPLAAVSQPADLRSEEHTSELQSHSDLVCRLLLEKKKNDAHFRHSRLYRKTYDRAYLHAP